MKLLLFSDIHTDEQHCRRIVESSKDADIVIGAGDYCSLRRNLSKVIGWLSRISKPTILVPGNSESYEELSEACMHWTSAKVLHGSGVEIRGVLFYGIGGGIPITPFGSWSYDFTEEQARGLLYKCPKNAVLITHSPPRGILDKSSFGMHLGSRSVRECIEEKVPRLVVCGHIHESGGKIENLGRTIIVNAGPKGIILELME